ncbi:hypothetical protein [Tuwongella immobilis]|uniref:Uncharacterized protein n=1 Tax=Tuwongella immobilis TaxID=692036 RepID=A0A6C2YT31_9BACT|nr:hypothetical protein [Tuwongella immobilis]VIP04554.1 unnamed protein product [Tuwongella immobilis]VTS06469.1 unnamed protein product [Tuwongella immobilis]
MQRTMNLGLMLVWLLVGLGILLREFWVPADVEFPLANDPQRLKLLGYLALGLAAWNFMRWFMTWSAQRTEAWEREQRLERERLLRDRKQSEAEVVNPALRFDAPDDGSSIPLPPKSANEPR